MVLVNVLTIKKYRIFIIFNIFHQYISVLNKKRTPREGRVRFFITPNYLTLSANHILFAYSSIALSDAKYPADAMFIMLF